MLKLDTIPKFIRFVIDLFNDEFDYAIDNVDCSYYFSHGGCYELAKIIKYYFKDAEFVLRNDFNHVGILHDGKIYDVYDGYSREELQARGIPESEYVKNIEDFKIITKEQLDKEHFGTGKPVYIENKEVATGIIDELGDIGGIKIGNSFKN